MNTENETGVKVPKGQINYNTVAGSLGLAAFAGLGLRNWLGNGNGSVAAGATAVAETQLVSGLMAELAKEKSERYADNVGINTFKEALALIKEERETRQANDKIIFETLARLDKESALNKQDNELDFIIEPTLDYIIKPQLAKLSKFIPDEQIPKVVNSYLDAAISKATAKGSVNLFGFEFEATAFQNLKREIDNSLKNNVSHDERPA